MSNPVKKIAVERPAWTREIDGAVAMANSENETGRAEALAWLARDLRARRRYWIARGPESSPATRRVLLVLSIVSTLATFTAYVTAWLQPYLACCCFIVFGPVSIGLWIATFVVHIGDTSNDRRIRGRGVLCPECDYDLSTTSPAVDPSRLGGLSIGPRTCQECGCAWPFVFPPLR